MSMSREERLRLARAAARQGTTDPLPTLLAKLNDKQRKAVENATPRWQLRYARVLAGEEGKTVALRVACAACVGFEQVEAAVGQCLATTCPLWLHRPYQAGATDEAPETDPVELRNETAP